MTNLLSTNAERRRLNDLGVEHPHWSSIQDGDVEGHTLGRSLITEKSFSFLHPNRAILGPLTESVDDKESMVSELLNSK